jgi:hypothetical protein
MSQSTSFIIFILVFIVVLGIRVWRSTREQRWGIPSMWVLPAIFVLLTAGIVAIDMRASVWTLPTAILGFVAGIGIGLYQGTHTTVRVDEAARCAYIKISPIGTLIFMSVLIVRIGLRFIMTPPTVIAHAAEAGATMPAVPPEAAIAGGALLALAAGSIVGLRVYVQRLYDAQTSR